MEEVGWQFTNEFCVSRFMKYFFVICLSFSFAVSFSQEFTQCNEVNVKLDKATKRDSISKYELVNSTGLISEVNGFTIVKFTFGFDRCENLTQEVGSNRFSEFDKMILKKLRPGDFIFFEKIKARDENGKMVDCKAIWYWIHQ